MVHRLGDWTGLAGPFGSIDRVGGSSRESSWRWTNPVHSPPSSPSIHPRPCPVHSVMTFRIFNTMTRSVEEFEPLRPPQVSLYTCGPTVYDAPHIGNLRSFVFEDVLRRSLELFGYDVSHVMNLTDIEDKIIAKVMATGLDLDAVTEPHIEAFFENLDALAVLRAHHYPRATRYIAPMIEMIETLVSRGHAYEADGSVYFSVESFGAYGRLSRVDLSQMRRGERIENDEYDKADVRDFVLWKAAKEGEPSWPSPWGAGRPGWHIECSAMARDLLAENIDMHCGGVDNIFPHHENEIAQSECSADGEFARYWVHAEHLLVDGRKMSKSLGNQYLLADLEERGVSARAVRYLFTSVHYRQKLNFTFQSAEQAQTALRRIDEMRIRARRGAESGHAGSAQERAILTAAEVFRVGFRAAIGDDLNVSQAHGELFQFVRLVNRCLDQGAVGASGLQEIEAAITMADSVLGTLRMEVWKTDASSGSLSDEAIESLLKERSSARAQRDFAAADRLRDELEEAGVLIEDGAQGTSWRRSS